jgi:hypothetical protein
VSDLDDQLAMTDETWLELVQVGAVEGSDLLVEFAYNAPFATAAEALAHDLESTSVTVHAGSNRVGLRQRRTASWVGGFMFVECASQDTLRQWVTEMVKVGEKHGCTFDGWDAEAPRPPR